MMLVVIIVSVSDVCGTFLSVSDIDDDIPVSE